MDILGNFSKLPGDKNKRRAQTESSVEFSYSDIAFDPLTKIENKTTSFSVLASRVGVILLFSLLVLRLFYFQVVKGNDYQQTAESNSIRPRTIEATRGLLTDSNGNWLARNTPDFALGIYPSDLPKKKADRENVYSKLASIAGMSVDDIRAQVEKNGLYSLDMVVLKDHISHDDGLILEKKIAGIPGATVSKKFSREYAVLPGLAHILGYTGKVSEGDISDDSNYTMSDSIGKTGLEYEYEKYLRGKNGVEQIEKDAKGNIIRVLVQDGNQQPVSGDDISLYMDRGLQEKTAEALNNGIEQAKKLTGDQTLNSGAAIVMDVKTGGILSMVSLPDYDDNIFANGISKNDYIKLRDDPANPLYNRAIAGVYPPGSVSKIILASAGLMEGNITKNTAFNTPAAITMGSYVFPDWKDHSYETTNIERAIAESNNVFFYSVGGGFDKIKGLGIDAIKKWWELFGLGSKTGIDLPGEAAGLLPDPAWKQKVKKEPWYIGDTYHVSIGQGDLLVTPLQMVRATATIANGGTLLQPQLVKKITDSNGKAVKEFGPIVQHQNFLTPDVVKTVQEGMRLTVTDGSAKNLNDLPFTVAGKTGTAQFLNNAKTHAWFECYAPYENPQIAIVVLIDGGGEGYDIADPVAREIMQYYFSQHPVD